MYHIPQAMTHHSSYLFFLIEYKYCIVLNRKVSSIFFYAPEGFLNNQLQIEIDKDVTKTGVDAS